MPDIVIQAENIGKRYRIGGGARYKALRDTLTDTMTTVVHKLHELSRKPFQDSCQSVKFVDKPSDFWALKDVNFEVKRGEVVGIIGRNGAGKSTLLKILSRITEPTEGRIELRGRVGSLLEVGTGFHPELTGRENIYLNGAILGMKRAEIRHRFDEIVEFSEISKFLDTPVKHYSSGMYMRLAFSVAAHLEPEILLVDEVLAVGDAEFQRKCLGKMGEVAKGGRTVLFVSHDMSAIQKLCTRVIMLDQGRVRFSGSPNDAVAQYIKQGATSAGEYRWTNDSRRPSASFLRPIAMRIRNHEGQIVATLDRQRPFHIEMEYEMLKPVHEMQVGFWLMANDGTVLFVGGDLENEHWRGKCRENGVYTSAVKIPGGLLNGGRYLVRMGVDAPPGRTAFLTDPILDFVLEQTGIPAHSAQAGSKPPGYFCLSLEWEINKVRGNT